MNPIEFIDPEIDATEEDGYYLIEVNSEYGLASIRVKKWVADAAIDEARDAIEEVDDLDPELISEAKEMYAAVFDRIEEELHD